MRDPDRFGERRPPDLIEVLDRVLDKGVVIDCVADVSIVGLRTIGIDSHMTIMSIETYAKYAACAAPPAAG